MTSMSLMTKLLSTFHLMSALWVLTNSESDLPIDDNGYVLYCPCMGRFGNQADHFLGALAFAHGLNRTLVLPPWVEYDRRSPKSIQVPFDKYFLVEPLQEYHRVMTMEVFMAKLAPKIWPPGKRTVFCYGARHGSSTGGCNAKDGNPFGPFWDTFNIDFDESLFYGPLSYETWQPTLTQQWNNRFPSTQYLVLAFTGAPASFPVDRRNTELHRYLQWSNYITDLADQFVHEKLEGKPFLGIHMRNGQDWVNVCKHVSDSQKSHLFASAQCLGYGFEHGQVTDELCFPPEKTILRQVKQAVDKAGVNVVFVASDNDPMLKGIEKMFKGKVKVVQRLPSEPHVDLAILGKAKHYIGNCVSTFSAFAARERRSRGQSVEFWAFKSSSAREHSTEL